uniref:Uncharacterized protein n=1 Tax=Arundo donax TaxID=35708 RepID=A0A0A9R0Q8_ARUDO
MPLLPRLWPPSATPWSSLALEELADVTPPHISCAVLSSRPRVTLATVVLYPVLATAGLGGPLLPKVSVLVLVADSGTPIFSTLMIQVTGAILQGAS